MIAFSTHLVNILLEKLDSINYRLVNKKVDSSSDGSTSPPQAMARLQKTLEQQNMFKLFKRLESAANQVKREVEESKDAAVYL